MQRGTLASTSPLTNTCTAVRLTPVREWLVGGALIQRPGEVLLVANRRANGSVDWTPPGGVIDAADRSLLDGLTREVREETGLEVRGWDGPCYEVVVEARGLGWRLRVEVWQATRVTGTLTVADPDGIVQEARYVPHKQSLDLLQSVAPWVREPLHHWLDTPWTQRRIYRYAVHGDDRATARVERLDG